MLNNSKSNPEPGVYATDVSEGTHSIVRVDTSRTAFIGLTKKGPSNKPIKIINFAHFERIFGALHKEYHLGYCVQLFFLNGGKDCYVIRVQSLGKGEYVSGKTILGKAGVGKSTGTGIRSLDSIDYFNLLCIPPYNKKNTVSSTVYRTALKYCESKRAILLIDPPSKWIKKGPKKIPSAQDVEKSIGSLRHPNAAFFYPHLRIKNQLDRSVRTLVPSGAVAGVIARMDSNIGVWKAPAGIQASIQGVTELETTLTDKKNGELNEMGINCLRAIPSAGIVIWGARTLSKKESNYDAAHFWKYIPVRRTALFIEESLYRGTKWAVFEPNDVPLWAKIRISVGAFMSLLFQSGAFQGASQSEAFFVKCDEKTTSQDDIEKGILNILVGFAPLKPAEFVIIKIKQKAGHNSNSLSSIKNK
jgi:phage tail sheath protein FI